MNAQAVPRPPGAVNPPAASGPSSAVVVRVESFFQAAPYAVRIEVRARNEVDALARLDDAYEMARRQLIALDPDWKPAGANV